MVLVIEFCAQLLGCAPKVLRDRLNHPEDRARVLTQLIGKKVQTTYRDRNGMRKTFFIGGMTERGAAFVQAYGRLRQPFNVNVAAHFYVRHRVKLHHPYAPCIIEGFARGEDRYYPLELIEIVTENDHKDALFGQLFREIDKTSNSSDASSSSYLQFVVANEDETHACYRDECSQRDSWENIFD